MDGQLRQWKLGVERLWLAAAPDYLQAARLAAEIAGNSEEATLRQAATQALPSLRNASLKKADRSAREQARRRLSAMRDVLHALSVPQFGKRSSSKPHTSEQRYRQMLGLPFDRGLSASEIHEAYKRLAKTAHPDTGGSEHEFRELTAAKDALMKEK
jgi:DnaJ domain